MPRNAVASRRYATALFEVTDKSAEAFLELRTFAAALKQNPEIQKFFFSPVISRDSKLETLADLKTKLPNSILFLEALIEANRMESLDGVVEEFERLCDEKSGELSVEVESASKLGDSMLEDIRSLLQDKWKRQLKIRTKINPDLIGGFVARAPGKLLDASVSSQLEALRDQIFV